MYEASALCLCLTSPAHGPPSGARLKMLPGLGSPDELPAPREALLSGSYCAYETQNRAPTEPPSPERTGTLPSARKRQSKNGQKRRRYVRVMKPAKTCLTSFITQKMQTKATGSMAVPPDVLPRKELPSAGGGGNVEPLELSHPTSAERMWLARNWDAPPLYHGITSA